MPTPLSFFATLLLLVTPILPTLAQQKALNLKLPTPNNGLFSGDLPGFYMHTDRTFEGVKSTPWQGGQYGYTRNEKRTSSGVIYTKFHEGIDIRPVGRDSSGRATDTVSSIAEGEVVHTSITSSHSSYGRYVVVKHDWGSGPFFSLYGHLEKVTATIGQRVSAGSPLGVMGCTGWAYNRDVIRSHLHLELNLMLHPRFPSWHDHHYKSPNRHTNYNGLNLAGIDVPGLFLNARKDPNLTLPEYIGRMRPYFTVAVPAAGSDLALLKTYPWLRASGSGSSPVSWEITLSRSGVPIKITPSPKSVGAPKVIWVENSKVAHSDNTRGRLNGSGSSASLSSSGGRYIQLITGRF